MIFDSHPLPDRYRHASKVRIHTWRRSVPQRGSVGSADTELHTGLMRTATRRYRVTVLTVSNNDFRLSSLPDRYRHASKVRIHTWRRSVPQRGSVGSADTKLHTGLMRTATRRYRVTVLTVSNNDFRLSSLPDRYSP